MRIGGISIIVDYSWLIIFPFIVVITKGFFAQAYTDYSVAFYWAMGGVASLLIFLSVLIHELAHTFVAKKYGIRIHSIRLHIFGSMSHLELEPQTGRHEFVITFAGWAVNMALGFFSLVVYSYFWMKQQTTPVAGIAACLLVANGTLAVIHMIPGFPLDGGRVLRAILWDRWGDKARATKVVSQVGNALALFFIIFGILLLPVIRSLFSILLVIIGLFMKLAAVGNYQSILQRQALAGIPVRRVMTDNVVSVDWLLSVEELVQDYIYKYKFTHFPVFNRDEFMGMVSLDKVKPVARELWTFKQVRDIITPIENIACARPTDDASEVLNRMVSEDIGCMPVIENGKLVGIVSRSDIVNLFKIKSDLGTA
jgi:Zn-dependent protease/predicted transcriptional regulator